MHSPFSRRGLLYLGLTTGAAALHFLQSTPLALVGGLVVWPVLYLLRRRHAALLVGLLSVTGIAGAQDLPRRPLFGAGIAPAPGGGVVVAELTPGASAERSGLRPGDRIVAAGGAATDDPPAFLAALAEAGSGAAWPLRVLRDGDTLSVTVTLQEVPRLHAPDFDVEYGAIGVEGALRRTVATVPPGAGPHPGVLLVGGVGCYTLDAPSPHPYHTLREALTRAGYATFWVEKSGMGDSEGPPCPGVDFDVELAGYRAGLAALQARPDVDPGRVFILGHSMGGLIGPLLAAEADVAGVVAVSTAGLPWMEYMLANLRRQLPLTGLTPAQVDAAMREAIRANVAVFLDERDPAELLAEHPSWAGFLALPQHVSYMRQVAAYDPAAVWAEVGAPVLLVAGGADFVTDPAEHERLRDVVDRAHPGAATYVLLDDLDHFLSRVPDAAASFRAASSGRPYGTYHEGFTETVLRWLDARQAR